MSWTHSSVKTTASADAEVAPVKRGRHRDTTDSRQHLLPMSENARAALMQFYRQRDEADAQRCASGAQKTRGTVYALDVQRLEHGEEVFESFKMLAAAGVALTPEAEAILRSLPQGWHHVCRIDAEGNVWTATLKEKSRGRG